jgi:hypothetical protein
MFFINLYTGIDRFLIRTHVKYSETLKDNGLYDFPFIKVKERR